MSVETRAESREDWISAREVVSGLILGGYRGERLAKAALLRLPRGARVTWDMRDPRFALTYQPVDEDGRRLPKSAVRVDFVWQLIAELGGLEAPADSDLRCIGVSPSCMTPTPVKREPEDEDTQKYGGRPANVTRKADLLKFTTEEVVSDLMGVVKDRAFALAAEGGVRAEGLVSVDDLIQVGVISVIELIPKFCDDRRTRFATLVRVASYRAMVDHLREMRPDDRRHEPFSGRRTGEALPDFADDLALWLDMQHALKNVAHADAWFERWLTDRSVKEMAAAQGEKPNTVTQRLERARRNLCLAIAGGDPSPPNRVGQNAAVRRKGGAGRSFAPGSGGRALAPGQPRSFGYPPLYPDPATIEEPQEIDRVARLIRRSNYDGRYRISFFEDGKRVHYLQFVTKTSELITLSMYEQLRIGWVDDLSVPSVPIYANLAWPTICREPSANGLHGLFDRFQDPPDPRLKTLTIAALLDPVPGGFRVSCHPGVTDRDGHPWPRIGLIVQARMNFWTPLLDVLPEIATHVVRVKKSGVGIDRRFDFVPAGPAIATAPDHRHWVDLRGYADEISSPERAEALLAPLLDDWSLH
jgi:DNA-directed RNA polymerase specialized sigma24 family protein